MLACVRVCEVVDWIKVTDDRVHFSGDEDSFTKGGELLTGRMTVRQWVGHTVRMDDFHIPPSKNK